MPQSFDESTWKARVAAWWRETGRDIPGAMAKLGVQTAYGLLSASAFLPLLEIYSPADPGPALAALSLLTAGVGSNLVANVVQNVYDKARAPQQIEQEIAEQPALRAEYQQMLGGVDAWGAAQAALGDQWAAFEALLRDELQQLGGGLHIEGDQITLTGNGAISTGSGSALGAGAVQAHDIAGDVVMGDKKTSFDLRDQHVDKQINVAGDLIQSAETPPTDLLCAYYRSLADDCRNLPLGTVDPKFGRQEAEGELTLREVYVNLDVVAPLRGEKEDAKAWGLRLARGDGDGRTPLLEALAAPAAARVVLLGDPGSGKTTFVNYLTYRMANALAQGKPSDLPPELRDLLPVRLVLRDVAPYLPTSGCGTAKMLWAALKADIVRRLDDSAAEKLLPYLQKRLLRDGGLFLLDGLDEVPEAGKRRACLLQALQQLLASLERGRVLLTARPYAYADPQWQLAGLPVLALAPFDDAQVERFVERWYAAVHPLMGWLPEEAAARGRQLVAALQERPRLGDLSSRPLLLTLMATLHTSWGQLPQDRAELYEESVKLLLARWQRAREVQLLSGERASQPGLSAALGVPEPTLRSVLEQLAYTAHARQGQATQRDDAQADIPVGEVLTIFAPRLPDNLNPQRVLTYLETRSGLLLGRRPGVYAFLHRSFQEYLAACYLANTEQDFGGRLRELLWDDLDWWREVFLLGVGKKRQGGLGDAVNVVNSLVPEGYQEVEEVTTKHWQAAALAGSALLDLDLLSQESEQVHYRAILKRVRGWLAQLVSAGHLEPRERLAAGDVLGRLGDPRPGVGVIKAGGQKLPDILWVHIPQGPFLMGSPADDEDAYKDEKPQHELTLPEYYIARYPVSNAQFAPFVEGDGYDNLEYWTPQGWAWRQGAEADLSVWDVVEDEDYKRSYREWLAGRPAEKRDCPFWWGDSRWGAATRPVVGVSWFEALAYTRWLGAQVEGREFGLKVWRAGEIIDGPAGACRFQLPSEVQWEKAARGVDGLKYPWDNDWREGGGNVKEIGLKQTSPVGMFPQGAIPYGCLDMAGNVWEWTRSRWGERSVMQADYGYPYDASDGRERLEGMKISILRGGSWGDSRNHARCAYRFGDFPDGFDPSGGFRVVLSLVFSDC